MIKKNIGSISVISTPIGNSDDITIRAIKTLNEIDFIACEDTRMTSKLCRIHKINYKGKLISYHDHNSDKAMPLIFNKLINGFNVAIVKSVPGPSALTAAMSISGISSDQFMFLGFLPRKASLRKKKIASLINQNCSIVIFESAIRIHKALLELYELLGNRNISIVREITKLYEENIRGNLSDIIDLLKSKKIKGEIVILIEKPDASQNIYTDKDLINMLKIALPKLGASRASKEISKNTSIKSDYIYKLAISLKKDS